MARYRTYLIFGAPGSGKGTQGKTLGTIPGYFHCACGDVFRSIDTSTELGQAFLQYSSKGLLVPDEITLQLWQNSIDDRVSAHQYKPAQDALILDGIPRNVKQAELMADIIDVRRVFHLSCPNREVLVERLKKRALKDNRLDDANDEVIRHRLATYENESRPLLDYYGDSLVQHIDASQSPIEVFAEIINAIICEEKKARG